MERHTKRLEMKTLPFDAHNHVHMGPSPPICAMLYPPPASKTTCRPPEDLMTSDKVGTTALGTSSPSCFLSGMALMSTHPNDFVRVQYLVNNLPKQVQSYANTGKTERDENDVDDDDKAITPLPTKTVACYGVHPWFLHELTAADWAPSSSSSIVNDSVGAASPRWLDDLESYLVADTGSIVGEIGLDGFHFDGKTKELTSPMEKQVQALEWQMKLAHRLQRPVSIHAVQCFGPLMECLSKFRRNLPPKLYFHAFGGKVGTVDQLLALCGRDIGKVYFGFAPIVNFRSIQKTTNVARKVGLERILLETDHEDATRVHDSMLRGISFMAECFQVDESVIVQQTTQNALDFYFGGTLEEKPTTETAR